MTSSESDENGFELVEGPEKRELMSLPTELLITIVKFCSLDSILSLLGTCRRLRQVSEELVDRYKKSLDENGLTFLHHNAGLDMTVDGLQRSLDKVAQSWIDANYKRKVSQLREATGSSDTFVFDDYIMMCQQEGRIRRMKLYKLDPAQEDPVAAAPEAVLEVGGESSRKGGLGSIGLECYDAGQDLLAFVHKRHAPTDALKVSLYTLRTLQPHPHAIEPVLTIPAHFLDGELEALFIYGRSIAFFMQHITGGDSIILIKWRGESIFPAVFKLESPMEQILHMVFLDEDHPMILTSARKPSLELQDDSSLEAAPVKLRMLELQPIQGLLSDAITAFAVSYLSEGPHFLFPPLKPNAYVDQEMSWILPYHPASPSYSREVASHFKPFPYAEAASYAGVFVVHLGGSANYSEDDEWQIQITILKADLIPFADQPLQDVEWDTWGRDATRIFQPRPDINPRNYPDPLKASFMTWVEGYRTASIAFDYQNELQLFHVLDFNPHIIRRIKEGTPCTGKIVTEPWKLSQASSPFLVNVETTLPFYVVDFDLGDVRSGTASSEPCMVRLSSLGVLFERDNPDTDETLVGYCWIDDKEEFDSDEEAVLI